MKPGIFQNFLLALCGMALFASFMLAHVWKQNRYIHLKKSNIGLLSQHSKLKNEVARVELDLRQLKDYTRLEKLGRKMGLDYYGVPELIFTKGSYEK